MSHPEGLRLIVIPSAFYREAFTPSPTGNPRPEWQDVAADTVALGWAMGETRYSQYLDSLEAVHRRDHPGREHIASSWDDVLALSDETCATLLDGQNLRILSSFRTSQVVQRVAGDRRLAKRLVSLVTSSGLLQLTDMIECPDSSSGHVIALAMSTLSQYHFVWGPRIVEDLVNAERRVDASDSGNDTAEGPSRADLTILERLTHLREAMARQPGSMQPGDEVYDAYLETLRWEMERRDRAMTEALSGARVA